MLHAMKPAIVVNRCLKGNFLFGLKSLAGHRDCNDSFSDGPLQLYIGTQRNL